MMPPAPARTAPMKNVAEIVRLMSMPISCAASRSWAVARIALPSLVRLMKTASRATSTAEVTMTKMSLKPKNTPATVVVQGGRMFGKWTVAGPFQRNITPSRKNDMPMAVMSGARRGALRSGR